MCENNELESNRSLIATPHKLFDTLLEHPLVPNKRDSILKQENSKVLKDFPGKVQVANILSMSQDQKVKRKIASKLSGRVEGTTGVEKKDTKGVKTQQCKDVAIQENMEILIITREDIQV
jgi:hypothetical protein